MLKYNAPPQTPAEEGPPTARDSSIDPYVALVGAFLRQAVSDAQRSPTSTGTGAEGGSRGAPDVQDEAQAFLLDQNRLAPWVELTGADVDAMQQALLRAAGLSRPAGG
jgi:hypothetical protein